MGCLSSKSASASSPTPTTLPNATRKTSINAGVQELKQLYNIDKKVLGSGSFGKVFKAENKADPSIQVAIKVIAKEKLSAEEIESLHQEVSILQTLDHPNIVKYYETYEDQKFVYLVMELCPGGELFEKMAANQTMNENMAAQAIEKILRALIHCHKQRIVHRDLKPENIMYDTVGEVKLIDFGLAKQTQNNQKLTTIAGTPYFIAPEVLNGSYQKECDIWSLGVLLFVCVTGTYPFDSATKNRAEVFKKIQNCQFAYPATIESKLSNECKDLIKNMIVVNPKKRLTGEQCLAHPWFEKCIKHKEGTTDLINEGVLQRLRQFKGSSTLKKAVLNVFVKMLTPGDIESLREDLHRQFGLYRAS